MLLIVSLFFVTECCFASGTAEPVRLHTLKVGGFWKQQFKRLTEKWLPHCVRQMETGGRGQELLNLVEAGRLLSGASPQWKYTGTPWSDAYVYNTLEAICLALAMEPEGDAELARAQSFLRSKIEEWIPIILAAQDQDGYIHSFHVVNGHPRYSNVNWHEFYVMGYFLEMGVAHYRMTQEKDRRLYDAALKLADHLDRTFGPAPKRTWKNGHAGLEYALCRLGRLVNELEGDNQGDRYIQLARHFLDRQHEGERPSEYNQSEKPAIDMTEARGHAVRATYFYTAMADMALEQDSAAYGKAVDLIWDNAIHCKHYLTGGVGASHQGEAFDDDHKLPNNGYCESCAGCGLSFWSERMHRLHGHGHYRDVQERVLYNNILGAIELTGENFFYQNPLASDRARYAWHGCPCCVGNIPRALLALKDLMYALDAERNELYISHFVDSEAAMTKPGGGRLRIQQETDYPWDGKVTISLHPAVPSRFGVKLRIPDRTESRLYAAVPDPSRQFTLTVNGKQRQTQIKDGYVCLTRRWQAGDRIELTLPMPVQRVYCDERIKANRGRVALQRGPLTYNLENVDHRRDVKKLVLTPEVNLSTQRRGDLLDGVTVIQAAEPPLMAIPNYVRLNRGGWSQVWLIEDPERIHIVQHNPVRPDLDPRTVDRVLIGDRDSERQHRIKGEHSGSGQFRELYWRHATNGGWFSYKLKVTPQAINTLLVSYWGDESGDRKFDLMIDGTKIAQQSLLHNKPGEFFDVRYPLPADLIRGKKQVTVTLQALPGATAGGVAVYFYVCVVS